MSPIFHVLSAVPLVLGATFAVAAPKPAAAPNCALAAPPVDAGIDRQMGVLLKIYPRSPDIGAGYAGCQTLWAQSDEGWEVLTVLHYQAGHVVRVENPARAGDPVEQCRVRDGVVLRGDPGLCAQLDDMRLESLPADCIDSTDDASGHCVRR